MNAPFPWERLLWRGRPVRLRPWLADERYYLSDLRLVRESRCCPDEILIEEIGDVARTESRTDRVLGTSTLIVTSRHDDRPPFVVGDIRHGDRLAAVLELLAADPQADNDAIRAALTWEPRASAAYREAIGAVAAVLLAIVAAVIGIRGNRFSTSYAFDDVIQPGGSKRPMAEIVRYMDHEVMPWARRTLGRIVGGPDRVTCETCHGDHPEDRAWQMPAVAALPEPLVRERGFELYSASMDAQMRNAIYGYSAEPDNSARAAYMREVVLPGMAALLHRPAYDFTRSYEHNRARNALGCYHCHMVR